jgi:hypothetical protein
MHRWRGRARVGAEVIVIALSLAWLGLLGSRPAFIPVQEITREIVPLGTQVLSGVKGQTFRAPTGDLARIDLWADTEVQPGTQIRVRFELARGVRPRTTIADAIVVFDRSRQGWQVQLQVDPALIERDDRLYLRLESILGTPSNRLFYRYSGQDVYPDGELLDLDRVEVPDQDLLFTLYRAPALPKPLAWAELLLARAGPAAERASVSATWIVAVVLVLMVVAAVGVAAAAAPLIIRLFRWPRSALTLPAVFLGLLALGLAIVAGGEIPIGKLVVDLA